MQRPTMFVLALAALVAAGALGVHVLRGSPSRNPDDAAALVEGRDLEDLARRLARLEDEVFEPRLEPRDPYAILERLERRIRVLEERPATVPAAPASREAKAVPADELESIEALTDEALLARARALSGRTGGGKAVRYWQEVIDRGARAEVLVEAQYGLGLSLRVLKDHEAEETAFLEAARLAGPEAPRAQEAMFQVGWSRHFRGDHEGSRRAMEDVARSSATPRDLAGHARLHAGYCSQQLNDATSAREAYESMIRDFSGSVQPMHAWFVEQAEQRLKALEGK